MLTTLEATEINERLNEIKKDLELLQESVAKSKQEEIKTIYGIPIDDVIVAVQLYRQEGILIKGYAEAYKKGFDDGIKYAQESYNRLFADYRQMIIKFREGQ